MIRSLIFGILGVISANLMNLAMGQDSAKPAKSAVKQAWVTAKIEAPRVKFQSFESAAAGTKVSYHIYVPDAYENNASKRFPVVYWLHGSGGGLAGIPQVARLFNEAIESGKIRPCLVVFVNGLVEGMYVDWKDGSAPIETIIVKELVPHIDSTYRTIATRDGRLLDGYSMGGYVALWLARFYPERVGKIYTLGTKLNWSEEEAEREIKMLNPEVVVEKVPAFAQSLAERHGEHEWKSVMSKTASLMKDLAHTHLTDQDFIKMEHTVLLTRGGKDNMVTAEETEYVQRLIKNAQYKEYESVPHPFEKFPLEVLTAEIQSFF